jgi:serine/threonine protein kinase
MKKIVRAIDPSLHYKRRLRPSSLLVCQVEREGKLYVLKTTEMGYENEPGYEEVVEHLRAEEELLNLARGVPGITHLVAAYRETEKHNRAILKEFYDGKTLEETEKLITNTRSQKKLEDTIYELHSLGISRLDLCRTSNIVISPDGEDACLVDLGHGKLADRISSHEFKMYKEADLTIIRRYFSK